MAFSIPNLEALKADIAKVEEVVAIVEKYDSLLPVPSVVKTAIADLDALLKFAAKA